MLSNQVWLLAIQRSMLERGKGWQRGKLLLIRMLAIWGDGVLIVSPKAPLKILLSHESFRGNQWSGFTWSLRWGSGSSPSPLCADCCAGLLACYFPLFAILFMQFVCEIIDGEAKEEIWSPVSYLVFTSTFLSCGENQQVRQGDHNIGAECWAEMSRGWECLVHGKWQN